MAKKVVKLTDEELYDKALKLEASLGCLNFDSYKAQVCDNIIGIYKKLGDFKDCKERIERISKEKEEFLKQSKEYEVKAVEEDKIKVAKIEKERNEKLLKGRITFFLIMFLMACLLVAGILFYKSDNYKIFRAKLYIRSNEYAKAIKIYKNLDGFGPDSEKVNSLQYKSACKKMEDKSYQEAINEFALIEDYLEAQNKKTKCELKMIKDAEVNTSVTYGYYRWRIVEKEKGKALLVKSEPKPLCWYNDSNEDITWENSKAREYFNSDFIEEYLNPAEASHLVDTAVIANDSFKYKTSAGHDTVDKVFFLNDVQARLYSKYLNYYLSDWWLIGPGETQNKVQFVSYGEVMSEGYYANNRTINCRPAMWVSYE